MKAEKEPVVSAAVLSQMQQTIGELSRQVIKLTKALETANATIAALQEENARLKKRVEELEDQTRKDSHNSSKPPSSDYGQQRGNRNGSLRKKSGKKPGGQPGHQGHAIDLPHPPDEVIPCTPKKCEFCPKNGKCVGNVISRRYIIDEVKKIIVTEYDKMEFHCPKGGYLYGEFPKDAVAAVQYGNGVKAEVIMHAFLGVTSVSRNQEMLGSNMGISLSAGTISNMIASFCSVVKPTVDKIKEMLYFEKVVHFDETGISVNSIMHWLHTASTKLLTYLSAEKKRGKEGTDHTGILPGFKGVAIHDFWSCYFKYKDAIHGVCNAHLLRELIERYERTEQQWCLCMQEWYRKVKADKELRIEKGETEFPSRVWAKYSKEYDKIINDGITSNPIPERKPGQRGRTPKGKTRALVDRFFEHKAEVCLFATDFDVPFDNNTAERSLRWVKIKKNVSGCFRTFGGAEQYAIIQSFLNTARKRGFTIYEAIKLALKGTPDSILALA